MHWYGQPKTSKQNTTYIVNTKQKKLPELKTKLHPGLVRLDLQPGNEAGPFLQPQSPHRSKLNKAAFQSKAGHLQMYLVMLISQACIVFV